MNKKYFKFITIFLFLVVLINCFSPVMAAEYKWNFKSLDGEGTGGGVVTSTQNVVGTIISVIRVVGTGVALIMITYVAIKYMSAAPQEKADFKKSATAYIVGAIVLMGSTNILKIISDFATTNIVTG